MSTPRRRGAADEGACAKGLPRSYRSRGLTAEIATHRNILRIDWPRQLTAKPSAAIVRKRAD